MFIDEERAHDRGRCCVGEWVICIYTHKHEIRTFPCGTDVYTAHTTHTHKHLPVAPYHRSANPADVHPSAATCTYMYGCTHACTYARMYTYQEYVGSLSEHTQTHAYTHSCAVRDRQREKIREREREREIKTHQFDMCVLVLLVSIRSIFAAGGMPVICWLEI